MVDIPPGYTVRKISDYRYDVILPYGTRLAYAQMLYNSEFEISTIFDEHTIIVYGLEAVYEQFYRACMLHKLNYKYEPEPES